MKKSLMGLLFGALFGFWLSWTTFTQYETIFGALVFKDLYLWVMFGTALAASAAGLLARSTALLADSLDMAGDAFVYGISLYAIGRSVKWNASISLVKGCVMTLFGVGVFVQAIWRCLAGEPPVAYLMGSIGALALAANIVCVTSHRTDPRLVPAIGTPGVRAA